MSATRVAAVELPNGWEAAELDDGSVNLYGPRGERWGLVSAYPGNPGDGKMRTRLKLVRLDA